MPPEYFYENYVRAEAARITLGDKGFLSGPIDLGGKLPTPDQIRATIDDIEKNGTVPTVDDWRFLLKPYDKQLNKL